MMIFLIGFMGVGKTTLGKELAKSLNYKFLDLDDYIESIEESTISNIFKNFGENYFRKIEHDCLKKILNRKNIVVATGGGTPCFFDNISLMNQSGKTVYISLDSKQILCRLSSSNKTRPLLDKYATADCISTKILEREEYYNQAQIKVMGENLTADKLQNIFI